MFDKLLIANRGEIACRVIRTARQMGIGTVAVFSDADREALHTTMADESIHIGESPSTESYLRVDRIIAACKQSGAQAVHPGYGFLSENPMLVAGLEAEGIIFVGPPSRAIQIMGDKIASKALALSAGVPTVPGFNEVIQDADQAVQCAEQIGYPVMLKASAGGGGKGMRIAHDARACREGFERASSEARSSFGDDRIFVEKFISEPRHIEVQVLADQHGHVIHLNERECSIQRRHQKVLEEAPSSFVDSALRKAMGDQAIALARAVDYVSAGTVEFIVDRDRNFYFLEMNTRLQVEHPVTEMITGIDLVEWMLRIAAGESLTLNQADIPINGWSMESRIYAEDPYRGFLPSSGRVTRFRPPIESKSVRVDTGLIEGQEVGLHYDPMIAKLITHGTDRDVAADAMIRALDQFEVDGIASNTPFLATLVSHRRFRSGDITTAFIEEEFPDGFSGRAQSGSELDRALALVAVIHDSWCRRARDEESARHEVTLRFAHFDDQEIRIELRPQTPGWVVQIGDTPQTLLLDSAPFSRVVNFSIDGIAYCAQVVKRGLRYEVSHSGHRLSVLMLEPFGARVFPLMPKRVASDRSHLIVSPMPGLLVSVGVKAGDRVKAGQEIAVVEAMKMENVIRASRDGEIMALRADVGAALSVDQCIAEMKKESSA